MKKTPTVTAAIAICCVLMVVVVIYTPKPTPEPTKGRETLEENLQRLEKERAHLNLTNEALRKASEAGMKANEAIRARLDVHQLIHEEKVDFKLLIEANAKAIERLTEAIEAIKSGTVIASIAGASEAIKRRNEELQLLNEEKASLKPLIEANIKVNTELIEGLTEVSEAMKALTEELQLFEKVRPWPSHEAVHEASRKVQNTLAKALDVVIKAIAAQCKASKAHHEYQQTRIRTRR